MKFSRRSFFSAMAGVGGLTALRAQVAGPNTPPLTFTPEATTRSTVAIVKGDVRRQIVRDALNAIDHQIRPVIQRKKYVIIKVNNVSTTNQLAATHADTQTVTPRVTSAARQPLCPTGAAARWTPIKPAD